MAKEPKLDIPENLRAIVETNVEKARDAYHSVLTATRKAQENLQSSSEAMASGAQTLHAKTLKFAEENVEASFKFANELLHAQSVQDALRVQQEFARAQVEAYTKQAKEVTKIVSSAQKKAQTKS